MMAKAKKTVRQVSFDALTFRSHLDFKNMRGAILNLGDTLHHWHITASVHVKMADGQIEAHTLALKPSDKISLRQMNILVVDELKKQTYPDGTVVAIPVTARIAA